MIIQNESHVTMNYTLKLDNGEVVDQSQPDSPIEFVCGHNQIIPGLEKGLLGKKKDDSFEVKVLPEDGYGEHQPELVQKVPMSQFPNSENLQVGMTFQARSPQGMPVNFVIAGIEEDMAVVDLNHPLAGKTLVFEVVIKGVRKASQKELDDLTSHACSPDDASSCGGGCSCG